MSIACDEANPLIALLAQAGENTPTPLDNQLKKLTSSPAHVGTSTAATHKNSTKNQKSKNINTKADKPNNSQKNQPSGEKAKVSKKIDNIHDEPIKENIESNLTEANINSLINDVDPVIVFDSLSSSTNDGPITLSVRQPSFVSLSNGQVIPKGSGSLAEFTPIIEEAVPNMPEDIDEIENAELPEIQMVQTLTAKNRKRWGKMGYEPPEDLIPSVRAASQAGVRYNPKNVPFVPISASENCIEQLKIDNNLHKGIPDIIEEEADDFNNDVENIRNLQKKAPSEGMRLAEAMRNQSVEMMREIIGETPEVKEMSLEEIPDEEAESSIQNENSQNINNDDKLSGDSKEEENYELFGHLADLDESLTGPPVYRTLLTGEVHYDEDTKTIGLRLKQISDICANHLWIEECSYVNNLLILVNQTPKNVPRLGFTTRKTSMNDIDRLKEKLNKAEEEAQRNINDVTSYKDKVLEQLDEEYNKRANELDEKYQNEEFLQKFSKPSKELLELRAQATRLLKQNRINEAARITSRIRSLEAEEQRKIDLTVKNKYYMEDRKLKEEFANARQVAIQRWQYDLSRVETLRKERVAILKKRIVKIESIMEEKEILKKLEKKPKVPPKQQAYPATLNSQFTENGVFIVKPPKRLKRENDQAILDGMTQEIINGKNPQNVNVESVFRKTIKNQKQETMK
ncbi:hypothetical protein TRFO_35715 [Tritrichomonas foetus]|uniref:Uncharacterized protein n=1 Tax=Tritrichomonas foetus TaxID=1144522 RepID=A0A1J4JK54_9EUKA|nr:hypothetical protein TRFO_35715 [Tritrichomonas foetus]|eukprot:OHS97949.1 hypothetical protein TRFO_35715 [Tritrichomonas foetus]